MNQAAVTDFSLVFVELGVIAIGLGILTRVAYRLGFSAIPLYLIAGLAFGNGGFVPLRFSEDFVRIVAETGVLLLLFMLGLEYTGEELGANLRSGWSAGLIDFGLNFTPGLIGGLLLDWEPMPAVLLGGVTWISSSGVIARVLEELGRLRYPETRVVVSVLVLEDLAMALYLPLVAVLLIGQSWVSAAPTLSIALLTVSFILFISIRYGTAMSRFVAHQSDSAVLFTILGLVLLVGGTVEHLQVSAAIGAFLVGIAVSGPLLKQTRQQMGPLRDLYAATFFLFFGMQIDPATLPPVMWHAVTLGFLTALTKLAAGYWAARREGMSPIEGLRAGATLTARGEFSIIIADLGVRAGVEPQLGGLAAAYVLLMAVIGPILTRTIEPLYFFVRGRSA